ATVSCRAGGENGGTRVPLGGGVGAPRPRMGVAQGGLAPAQSQPAEWFGSVPPCATPVAQGGVARASPGPGPPNLPIFSARSAGPPGPEPRRPPSVLWRWSMGKKLYVSNLPYGVGDRELGDLFGAYGPVRSAQVALDRDTGRSRGFG